MYCGSAGRIAHKSSNSHGRTVNAPRSCRSQLLADSATWGFFFAPNGFFARSPGGSSFVTDSRPRFLWPRSQSTADMQLSSQLDFLNRLPQHTFLYLCRWFFREPNLTCPSDEFGYNFEDFVEHWPKQVLPTCSETCGLDTLYLYSLTVGGQHKVLCQARRTWCRPIRDHTSEEKDQVRC